MKLIGLSYIRGKQVLRNPTSKRTLFDHANKGFCCVQNILFGLKKGLNLFYTDYTIQIARIDCKRRRLFMPTPNNFWLITNN